MLVDFSACPLITAQLIQFNRQSKYKLQGASAFTTTRVASNKGHGVTKKLALQQGKKSIEKEVKNRHFQGKRQKSLNFPAP